MFDPTHAGSLNSITEIDLVFIGNEDFNLDNELKTTNPAVFEVKNEDTVPVDIYYEASQEIPILLDGGEHYGSDIQSLIQIGSQPYCPGDPDLIPQGTTVLNAYRNQVWLSNELENLDDVYINQTKIYFPSPSGGYYASTIVNARANGNEYWSGTNKASEVLHLQLSTLEGQIGLDWYNCIAFGNGVESAFLRDDFNEVSITKGVRASSTIEETVKKEHKKNGLIYSGLYNTASNINSLNEFITAEKITKDINPTYGSIQKLHTRDTDLITLCEDKILRILANKDAIFNADGNTQLTATQNVLGQTIPFVGEYGISKNPESFASESYRAYFTDKSRGTVLRLSKDGR